MLSFANLTSSHTTNIEKPEQGFEHMMVGNEAGTDATPNDYSEAIEQLISANESQFGLIPGANLFLVVFSQIFLPASEFKFITVIKSSDGLSFNHDVTNDIMAFSQI